MSEGCCGGEEDEAALMYACAVEKWKVFGRRGSRSGVIDRWLGECWCYDVANAR